MSLSFTSGVPDIYTEPKEGEFPSALAKRITFHQVHLLFNLILAGCSSNLNLILARLLSHGCSGASPGRSAKGFIVRIESGEERVGWGEVAPLPAFGTETMGAAREILDVFSKILDVNLLKLFPCTKFGVSSALASQQPAFPGERVLEVASFLPQGNEALEVLSRDAEKGFRTFKWKVGPLDGETKGLFGAIIDQLPEGGKIRLDANGLLRKSQAEAWLDVCEGKPVEFFEQPHTVLEHMQTLAEAYSTPLALDESVTTLAQCKKAITEGWDGLFVIKPSTIGDWGAFCAWHATVPGRCVYSTAFETAVGASAGLRLAALDPNGRAVGYGALCGMPQDGLGLDPFGPEVCVSGTVDQEKMEALWNAL